MRHTSWTASLLASLALAWPAASWKTYRNFSAIDLPETPFSVFDKRPDDCPPCFNCNLEDFKCQQFGECSKANGKCSCPPGFGGEDCSEPLCGALPDGRNRSPRGKEKECQCKEGWTGINCNTCQTDQACDALMPEGEAGVCLKTGQLVSENFQMCDITNRKILDQLKDQIPQATFSCNQEAKECNFQCKPPLVLIVAAC
jgi:hypothetical protein